MSVDSANDKSYKNCENGVRSNDILKLKHINDMDSSPSSSHDRKGYRERDRTRSPSPSRLYGRKSSSRQGKRDRLSRDDRTPSPISPVRNSRRSESRTRRYRDERDKGRSERRRSKDRSKRREKKRSRSRSRHRSPKRNRKSKRRYSSGSDSADPMRSSLLGEIKRTHGSDVVSRHKKKSKRRHRQSSSSSTSSEEMRVEGASSSNGNLNIPIPMPPPQLIPPDMMYMSHTTVGMCPQPVPPPMGFQRSFFPVPLPPIPPPMPPMPPAPAVFSTEPPLPPKFPPPMPPSDMFPMVPPPQPPPGFTKIETVSVTARIITHPKASSSNSHDSVQSVAVSTSRSSRMMEGLPMPPENSRRVATRPVLIARRGTYRRLMESDSKEWGGALLQEYDVQEQIGEGTYGQVYKAVHKATGEQVALKRVRLEHEKEGFPITAVREIKILRQLNHKNIVRLIDIVSDNTSEYDLYRTRVNFYLVFEYVDHDLMGLLESKELIQFTADQICALFKQLLEGLAYCHKAGFLHRDIKCSNILVNNRGELKVADLGLARFWNQDQERPYTNRVITLWYRPPELLYGEEHYGPSVDVWSVGCMLGELFTRKPLFNGNNEMVQLDLISKMCGTPTEDRWPEVTKLSLWNTFKPKKFYPRRIREEFEAIMPAKAVDLLDNLLVLDPKRRLTAHEALRHPWIMSLDRNPPEPLRLPRHQDCHEMWSKKQKRGMRTSLPGGQKSSGSGGSGMQIKDGKVSSRQSNGGGGPGGYGARIGKGPEHQPAFYQ